MPASLPTAALTLAALVAFAANSLLCRLALGAGAIDAATFTSVRIASGVLALWLLLPLTRSAAAVLAAPAPAGVTARRALAAAMLFGYAIAFSYAYRTLSAGTGALILFGAVQTTMLLASWRLGERLRPRQWAGVALALGGLVALVAPGVTAPEPIGAALMASAGIAWGAYSLLGRGAGDPLAATRWNFTLALPLALATSALLLAQARAEPRGVVLAVLSGAFASGLGYVAWYAALRGLRAAHAAVVQLAVPVLTALAGVALLGEALDLRLVACGSAVLGGIALAVMVRR